MNKKYDLEVLFAKENDRCIIPSKRNEDAGYDLYVDPKWLDEVHDGCLLIMPHQTVMIPTGIRSVIPTTHYAQVEERGSTGVKAMKFGAGVIDSGFRGVWNAIITNCSADPIMICNKKQMEDDRSTWVKNQGAIKYPSSKGVAQFVFLEVPKAKIVEVSTEEIMSYGSERGEGKLGSSEK